MTKSFGLLKTWCVLCVLSTSIFAGQTYFGASGYSFVPDGMVKHDSRFGGYFSGEYASIERTRLYPRFLGMRWTNASERLELSLSSVSAFVGDDGFRPRKVGDGLLPVIPGIKWNIDDKTSGRIRWAYSVGAMFPYGVYGATTVRATLPIVHPELSVVMATTAQNSTHLMVGSRLQFADLNGKSLPIAVTGEAAWASSMDSIGETAEAFYAIGLEFQMGRNLTLISQFRQDPRIYRNIADNSALDYQNTNGKWALKLEYQFSGVKDVSTPKKKDEEEVQ